MNGMIDKVLYQLLEFQDKNQLKINFDNKIEVIDRDAIKIALEII
jgi:hypothetical protein